MLVFSTALLVVFVEILQDNLHLLWLNDLVELSSRLGHRNDAHLLSGFVQILGFLVKLLLQDSDVTVPLGNELLCVLHLLLEVSDLVVLLSQLKVLVLQVLVLAV